MISADLTSKYNIRQNIYKYVKVNVISHVTFAIKLLWLVKWNSDFINSTIVRRMIRKKFCVNIANRLLQKMFTFSPMLNKVPNVLSWLRQYRILSRKIEEFSKTMGLKINKSLIFIVLFSDFKISRSKFKPFHNLYFLPNELEMELYRVMLEGRLNKTKVGFGIKYSQLLR